ncbi:ATPase domain-containing protein [Variovorax sp. PAMC 28711]|uniref:ATPase domain-containing protein n=1 Tax=Variovorax sp. PAMC 28711 TaxID=1795631 RepID=UPI00078DEE69|nr:ATPase domain-containing protein [Variovorax sp. PAMC 28711]AMM25167.1 circadian clock protein KaiC [Variovorax sp. PAMC 28711]
MVTSLSPFVAPVQPRASTGIAGLDSVLGGGLPRGHLYLLEGSPGAGKTTLGLQFLLEARALGERGLYVTLSETADELRIVAGSHGWSLDGVEVFELVTEEGLSPSAEQSILYPSEVELGETTRGVMAAVERLNPSRVVFDSLSEMRLLAQDPLRYRRQILALKHFFAARDCTVLLLDDMTSSGGDLQLHSIAHGVLGLTQVSGAYGPVRRHLRILKMRGVKYRGGEHDVHLDTGGIEVFPRLIASEHRADFELVSVSTGNAAFDAVLGGGLTRGSNTLFIGPSGVGKTTSAMSCVVAALQRGENASYYLFDEGIGTLLQRCEALNLPIRHYIDSGQLQVFPLDPAEVSPGRFSNMVREAVQEGGARTIVIDSLNAYLQAMPGAQFLLLQMHELLAFLNQQGIVTMLVLGQHGIIGDVRSDLDLSYLSDSIVLFRFFESQGQLLKAVSVVKSRTHRHELTIREFRLGDGGVEVGPALTDFQGVLAGVPSYSGGISLLGATSLEMA